MSGQNDFRDYCLELLGSLRQGEIASKKMFGGTSFSIDGKTFAIIAFDQLWLKVDDECRAEFEAAKCRIFTYEGKTGLRTMNYYTVPEEAMESAALMRPWAMLGWAAALRAAAEKSKPKAKRASVKKNTEKPL
ncbi:MAG: TfoX family protein [Betaproteobacteria bacterium]|nr:MAG: TfoX family protein [Betaproteobacteria bacterium]